MPSTCGAAGKSEGERFYVDDVAEYVADIGGVIDIAKERHPGLPVYLLGHSAGASPPAATRSTTRTRSTG